MAFKRLDQEDISISAESVVAPLWSTGVTELTSFFTSSGQVAANTGDFYFQIFQADTTVPNTANPPKVQFDITYGHKLGSGSMRYNAEVEGKSPTSTIYGQYRSLIYGDEEADFVFGTEESDSIYIINYERARYKEKLFPGSFNLKLTNGSDSLELTDNSKQVSTVSYADGGRIYDIISGSNGTGTTVVGVAGDPIIYGKFLPDIGVVVLNGDQLDENGTNKGINLGTIFTTGSQAENIGKFYDVIKAGDSTTLQSEETISSNYVFVRVRNSEFNYSTNPSNITSSGELKWDVMINTPQAYVTTVGLYNDSNDLLAVAKLSRPLLKDFTKEALVRIKLDY